MPQLDAISKIRVSEQEYDRWSAGGKEKRPVDGFPAGRGYVSVFSIQVGFVYWYHGLALDGTAGVGQLQHLQPFFGLVLAWLLLKEPVALSMLGASLFVVICVASAKRYF